MPRKPDPAGRAGGRLPLRPNHASRSMPVLSRSAYRALVESVIIAANRLITKALGLIVISVVGWQTGALPEFVAGKLRGPYSTRLLDHVGSRACVLAFTT
jgi:hypothetical protein